MESGRPFTTAFHVGQMLESFDRLFALAPTRAHIVPGHDPEVMRRYPAPRPELEGIAIQPSRLKKNQAKINLRPDFPHPDTAAR